MASNQNDRLNNTFGVQSLSFSGSQSNANTNSPLSSSDGTQTLLFQVPDYQTQTPLFQVRFGGCPTNTNTPLPNSGSPSNTNTNSPFPNTDTNSPFPNANTNSLFSSSPSFPLNTHANSPVPNTNTKSPFSNTNTNSPFSNTNMKSPFSFTNTKSLFPNTNSLFPSSGSSPSNTNMNSHFPNTNTNSLFSSSGGWTSNTNTNTLFTGFGGWQSNTNTNTFSPSFVISQSNTNTNTPSPILRMAKSLQLENAKHKNFVFSPCSILLAMSLIAHGANGSTLDELLTFLQVESLDQLTSVASNMVAVLTQHQLDEAPRAPKLSFVGGAWIDHSLSLSPSFISCAENIYKLKAEAVNFKYQVQEVVYKVNKWAEESTGGLIKSIVAQLEPDSILVLANALHFKGTWDQTFKKSHTRGSDFYLHNGETVEVPFMCSSEDQFIRNFDDSNVLRLPYIKDYRKKPGLSMYIILPHQRDGLWSLVDKVGTDPHFLEKYTTNNTIKVGVRKFMLPKFKMTSNFEASQFLKGVGLKSCFSLMEAEFHNMLLNPKIGRSLYVSTVQHKSYIEVDEEGTEAAAVTVLQMGFGSAMPKPPCTRVDFVADHPFMFMIKDDHSGMVLFLGHVINPLLI